jgi:hypothetical protein
MLLRGRSFRFILVIRFSPTLAAAVAAVLLLLMVSPLVAAPTSTAPRTATQSPRKISDSQLHDFAAAYGAVSAIRKNLLIKTHASSDKTKSEALKEASRDKMKSAILKYMTLDEYVRIGKEINEDPALHARFMKIRAQAGKPPSPGGG